jgi:hypothetical protein
VTEELVHKGPDTPLRDVLRPDGSLLDERAQLQFGDAALCGGVGEGDHLLVVLGNTVLA